MEAAFQGPRSPLALVNEGRAWREAAWLLRHPVWHGEGVPDGDGRPVLLVPGFLAGDGSLTLLTRWLRARGYWTSRSRIRVNADCTRQTADRLERRLEALTDRMGRPAMIVGQSRGGTLARLLAVRRPELVEGIVTLGTPNLDPLAVHPVVTGQVAFVAALQRAGVPGLLGDDCLRGDCAKAVAAELARPFPPTVAYTSIYSRSDGIVDWRACLDPAAEHVEVDSSHAGMSVHPTVYQIIGERLAAPPLSDREAPRWRAARPA